MITLDLKNQINTILKELLLFKVTELKEDDNLNRDIGLDSLDKVEFLIEIEKVFDIAISDPDFEDIDTLKDVYETVDKYLTYKSEGN